jgi:hypothetical protein
MVHEATIVMLQHSYWCHVQASTRTWQWDCQRCREIHNNLKGDSVQIGGGGGGGGDVSKRAQREETKPASAVLPTAHPIPTRALPFFEWRTELSVNY